MTKDRMALAESLEKGSDGDLLREMIGYVAQRLVDLDVAGLCGPVRQRQNVRAIRFDAAVRCRCSPPYDTAI